VKPMASYRSLAARRQVPILEQLPGINVNDLQIPRDYKTYIAPNISLRYGFLAGARLSWDAVEFYFPSLHRGQLGRVQTFELKHIKTGFGIRHAFICIGCDRAVITLYHLHGNLACRHCHGAVFASQILDKRTRPILQISRIQSFPRPQTRSLPPHSRAPETKTRRQDHHGSGQLRNRGAQPLEMRTGLRFNGLFTMLCGTTRARRRIMAELFLARSGVPPTTVLGIPCLRGSGPSHPIDQATLRCT
jgi:hypothetical protein